MRTTKHMLKQLLMVASKRSGALTYALDHDAAGYRLYTTTRRDLYGRELSPRLNAREMSWWLEGYITGLDINE